MNAKKVVVIGAGPAGLTAAYLLSERGIPVTVLEANPEYVGGISRTVKYKGFHFDIGGHRFFSKSERVEKFWTAMLPNDMLERPRSSRIFYRGKFFSYPLKAFEALFRLGIWESVLCIFSYIVARVLPVKNPKNFQDWVSNQFGKRLFRIFFETYTEKVWGMKCTEISADWATQRIKGLSLASAIKNAMTPQFITRLHTPMIKTLIHSFRYPRKGPGMMWETCAEKMKKRGGNLVMGAQVSQCVYNTENKEWNIEFRKSLSGKIDSINATDIISSAPLRELVHMITPSLTAESVHSADLLKYRDFITVMLIMKDRQLFSDNWIYIHDPSVKVGRIQNFKSWSPEMVPDPSYNCYGLEYFCFENDSLWLASDQSLMELAKTELEKIGLGAAVDVLDGCVVRQAKAYPVYDDDYAKYVDIIRRDLDIQYPSMHLVGRNGMHKYNNQDHAMMTAMLTVENILQNKKVYNIWEVNQDAEYHEGGERSDLGIRKVPSRVKA